MRKGIVFLLVCALTTSVGAATCLAQIDPPNYGENHYVVYDVPQTGIIFDSPIVLSDQFEDLYQVDLLELDLFANPAVKQRPGYEPELPVNAAIHQTWWTIDDFENPRRLLIENQFELPGVWYVKDGKYLILPAAKGSDVGVIPEPLTDPWNHYKCYEEISIGPPPLVFDQPVEVLDQFGVNYQITQMTRIYFCNPCVKEVLVAGGDPEIYPVINDQAHLAVYRIDDALAFSADRTVVDQFGTWEITIANPVWLVVPSLKNEEVLTESNTWGGVKSLYR